MENLHFGRLVGSSHPMMQVYDLIRRVKDNRINCMILGESGTGKEQVARAIHFNSNQKTRPICCSFNCGAIPETLMESGLFGHKKGSFTGAIRDKVGLFQAADKGTLFLDEIDAFLFRSKSRFFVPSKSEKYFQLVEFKKSPLMSVLFVLPIMILNWPSKKIAFETIYIIDLTSLKSFYLHSRKRRRHSIIDKEHFCKNML